MVDRVTAGSQSVMLFRMWESNCLVGVVEDVAKDKDGIPIAWLLSTVAIVRIWGTTAGFTQLAVGPTEKTVLDIADMPPGSLAEVLRSSVHYAIPAHDRTWLPALEEALARSRKKDEEGDKKAGR